MINDLDETLRQLLIQKTPLDPAQVEVNFELPDREWSAGLAKPTINLYLYDVRENRELRELDWITGQDEHGITRRRAPTRIDLSYLVTAWTRGVEDEHRLLWQALATFFRHPVLPDELLQGDLREQGRSVRLSTAQGDGVLKNPADFWAALDNQLKPSVSLAVTVELDLGIVITAPPVSEVSVGLTNTAAQQGDGAPPKRAAQGASRASDAAAGQAGQRTRRTTPRGAG